MKVNLEVSLLSQQRTYQQSQQPRLTKYIIQQLVEQGRFDKLQIQQFAPTLPIYVKMKKKWSPRQDYSHRSPSQIENKTKRQYRKLSQTIPLKKSEREAKNHHRTDIQELIQQSRLMMQTREAPTQRMIKVPPKLPTETTRRRTISRLETVLAPW